MGVALEIEPPWSKAPIHESSGRDSYDAESCCLLPIHGAHINSVFLSINPDVFASMVPSWLDGAVLPQTMVPHSL